MHSGFYMQQTSACQNCSLAETLHVLSDVPSISTVECWEGMFDLTLACLSISNDFSLSALFIAQISHAYILTVGPF